TSRATMFSCESFFAQDALKGGQSGKVGMPISPCCQKSLIRIQLGSKNQRGRLESIGSLNDIEALAARIRAAVAFAVPQVLGDAINILPTYIVEAAQVDRLGFCCSAGQPGHGGADLLFCCYS